jgi:8-oxo-dGTP pyrophosphatase MutT (NUDIX family)
MLIVVGVDPQGTEVVRAALGHGEDPAGLLAMAGWEVGEVRDVMVHPVERHVLTMTFLVRPSVLETQVADGAPLEAMDSADGEVPVKHQRVAAYALVTSSRGTLMTQFSDLTNAAGQWGLPGGGLEAGEAPEVAVVREVWEESGQVISVSEIALVQTSHWVGRAPAGQLEDFHAVRVIYRAICAEPTDPVLHDVGGTTSAAAWLLPAELDLLGLTPGWRSILRDLSVPGEIQADRDTSPGKPRASGVVMAPDEPDGPDRHHDKADGDDPAGPQP